MCPFSFSNLCCCLRKLHTPDFLNIPGLHSPNRLVQMQCNKLFLWLFFKNIYNLYTWQRQAIQQLLSMLGVYAFVYFSIRLVYRAGYVSLLKHNINIAAQSMPYLFIVSQSQKLNVDFGRLYRCDRVPQTVFKSPGSTPNASHGDGHTEMEYSFIHVRYTTI